MANNETSNELFRVGNKAITQNGLYSLIGPSTNRAMAVAYDPDTNKSTWVSPTGDNFTSDDGELMAIVIGSSLLEDRFDTPKPYLHFKGGKIEFDLEYKPTAEQIAILQNWEEKLENAGIGGRVPEFTLKDLK